LLVGIYFSIFNEDVVMKSILGIFMVVCLVASGSAFANSCGANAHYSNPSQKTGTTASGQACTLDLCGPNASQTAGVWHRANGNLCIPSKGQAVSYCKTSDGKGEWNTIGVHENVIAASAMALEDAVTYGLLRQGRKP
jgi:hypothetical protein